VKWGRGWWVVVVGWGSSEHRPFVPLGKQECLCHLRRCSLRWPRLKLGEWTAWRFDWSGGSGCVDVQVKWGRGWWVVVVGWGSSEHRPFVPLGKQECLCHLRRSLLRWPRLRLEERSDGGEFHGRTIKLRFVTIRNLEPTVFAGFRGISNPCVTIRNSSFVRGQKRGCLADRLRVLGGRNWCWGLVGGSVMR
jgi:hypothetical protein